MKYMLLIHQGTHPDPADAGSVGPPVRRRAAGRLRGLQGAQRDPRGHARRPDAARRDRDDGPGAGRQDAHDRRPVRRDQGSDRRLLLLRGRRPRRRDRRGLASPGGLHGRRDRGASVGGVVATLEQAFREQRGRVLAALIGFLGDFDLAEEAVQDAFAIAAERWPRDGVPTNPGGWLVTTARNRAVDRIRRDRTLAAKTRLLQAPEAMEDSVDLTTFPDERLELIFTCCHPALATEAQVALTLRTLGGLTTDEIAARLPRARVDDGPAAGAGEAQDQGGRDPVPGAARPSAARSARRGARGRLPDLQRGLRRSWPAGDRSDPARSGARGAHARRAGGARSPGAHAAARRPPGGSLPRR